MDIRIYHFVPCTSYFVLVIYGVKLGKLQAFFELLEFEFYRRPVLYAVLGFIIGIIAASKGLLHPIAALAFFFAVILCYLLVRKAFPLFLILFFFFLALPYYSWMNSYSSDHIKNYTSCFGWPRAEVTGTLISDPEIIKSGNTVNLLLEVESFKVKGLPSHGASGLIKLVLKEKVEYGDLIYGDRISVYARFHVPSAPKNPGEFDYKRYLERKGIFLTGMIDRAEGDFLEKTGTGRRNPFICRMINLKHRLLLSIEKTTPGEAASLVQGILLGEDSSLTAERKQQFRDTGTFHILAVSGFNVALVVAAFFFLLRFLKYGRKFSAGVSMLFVTVFCFVTGCSPSVVRASLICIFALFAVLSERDSDIINLLALSAFLMLIADPDTLFDIGFQLSYIGTLGLVLLAARVEEYFPFLPRFISGAVAVTVSAQLFVAPVSALYFNSFSTLTLPANLCIAPFVLFSTVAGLVQAIIGMIYVPAGSLIGYVNYISVFLMFKVVEYFSSFSFSLLRVAAPGLFFLFFYYTAVLVLVYFKKLYSERPAFLAGLTGLLALAIWLSVFSSSEPALEATLLSLRNSKAVFVFAGQEISALYIEGKTDAYEVERKILPLMRSKGVNKLKVLVYAQEFEPFVKELRPEKILKLGEIAKQCFSLENRAGTVLYAGGKTPLAGQSNRENFYADTEKLVYGRERKVLFYKDSKKNGAVTVSCGKNGWQLFKAGKGL